MAAYITEYFEKNNSVDAIKVLEYIKEQDPVLESGLRKIYEMEIPNKFNRGVFDVINQKPLDVQINQLKKDLEKCTDLKEKSIIVKMIGEKILELQAVKSKYIVDKGE